MSEPIIISLPYPPKELSPNGRAYFVKKNKIAQQYKFIAKMAAKFAKPRGHVPWERAETQVIYFQEHKRKMDHDNAIGRLKSALDSLALAGLIVNDSGLTHRPPQFQLDKERPRVEIILFPIQKPA